jgi:hypothetical protein
MLMERGSLRVAGIICADSADALMVPSATNGTGALRRSSV